MNNRNRGLSKLSLWLLVFAFFDTTNINAQKKFTIADCIDYAFKNNPLVDVAIKDTSIGVIDVQRVKGSYLPRVNFVGCIAVLFYKTKIIGGRWVGARSSLFSRR
jgi:hypothetical protein